MNITLIVGPPGAPKLQYALDNRGPSDLVIDMDVLARAVGSSGTYVHAPHYYDLGLKLAQAAVQEAVRSGHRAWVVSHNPEAELHVPHTWVVHIDPGIDSVLEGVTDPMLEQAVQHWYEQRRTVKVPEQPSLIQWLGAVMAGIVIYKPTRDLYNGSIAAIPGAVGSGIAAQKPGYHNSRANNSSSNYSVRLPLDRQGPSDGAAAIDITMSTANMKKYTKILMDAMDRKDPRVQSIKEVIGTLDGRNVVRYTRDSRTGKPTWATSDSSHLWHIHISLFRADINNWNKLKGIVEVLGGSTSGTKGANPLIGLEKGDKGEEVKGLQYMLRRAGFDPGTADGDYGNKTANAVLKMRQAQGSSAKDGNKITGAAYDQLMYALITKNAGTKESDVHNLPALGDSGTVVEYFQRLLSSDGADIERTGVYDNAMKAAVAKWFKDKHGGDFSGDAITSWIAIDLQRSQMKGEKGDPGEPGKDGKDGTLNGKIRLDGVVDAKAPDAPTE